MKTLESLAFDNRFAALPETYYSRVSPTPVPQPYLVTHSPNALKLLGLDSSQVTRPEFIETLAGNFLLPGMDHWRLCTRVISSAISCRNSATGARFYWVR